MLAAVLGMACTPAIVAPSGSPTASATPLLSPTTAAPTAATLAVSPPPAGRIALGDTPLAADGRAIFLFQAPGEERLSGVVWGEMRGGTLAGRIPLRTTIRVSPDGARYFQSDGVAPAAVFDRDGRRLGELPWTTLTFPSWARDGRYVCAVRPETPDNGSALRLETATAGQPARLVASGFGVWGNNASYPVLACDPASDRAVVASFGQGLFAGRFWVIRLSTGAVLHTEDIGSGNASSWLAATADGMHLAHSTRSDMLGLATTVIRTAESRNALQTIADFEARGFSDDGHFIVGGSGTRGPGSAATTAYVEWRPARRVWSAAGPYAGYFPQPAGALMAIAVSVPNAVDAREIYIVSPTGASVALASGSTAPLRN